MKIFSKILSYGNNTRRFSNVDIAKPLDNSVGDKALYDLQKVRGVFEPYAREKGVSMKIDRASEVFSAKDFESNDLRVKSIDDCLAMTVTDKATGKSTSMLINPTMDSFNYTTVREMVVPTQNNKVKYQTTISNYDDNFFRYVYRAFESLTKVLQK